MSDMPQDFSKVGFVKTFVLPGVLIFLVPILSLLFFLHAQSRFNAEARESLIKDVRASAKITAEKREKAIAFFNEHPFSELIRNEAIAAGVDSTTRFHYAMFRWMIVVSELSIAGGVAVYALAGACVWLSRRSQRAQYWSFSAGWQLLRIYGAIQVLVQGAMIVALSYYVTALWFQVYFAKLIGVAGLLAAAGAYAVIKAIFRRPKNEMHVEGKLLDPSRSPRLWDDLGAICEKVGTGPPDHVLLGIDDNFFATETPVHVDGSVVHGRTLYVSLALLKQMSGTEADAVLAHEMAHFSGNDTLYSKKIAPLLARYAHYLQSLSENPIARPVYQFMLGFRALFELSLGEHRRSREFRADRIASEVASPRDLAGALLRITAYSDFRGKIQQDLFDRERALETANISSRLEEGFHEHARAFAEKPDLGRLETVHPFDSHPPLAQRLDAIGVPIQSQDIPSLLASAGDGRWYEAIDDAEEVEHGQWEKFEESFRAFHEETLAFRLLPEGDEERVTVVKWFPGLSIEGKKGELTLDCDGMRYSSWPDQVAYSEITNLTLNGHTLDVAYQRGDHQTVAIPTKTFGPRQAEAIRSIQNYYSRYLNAAAYRKQKQNHPNPETSGPGG